MTRPSIFRCFFFLYRSLNFPAKKIKQTAGVARRSAVATPQQERRRRRRRSVDVVVAAVVAVVVVVGVSPRRRRCRSIASFGSCVCVCVCVCFLVTVFFCSHPPAGGDQWPSDFLPQSAPSSPSSAKTRHPPVSRTTRETKDGETRAARRSGAINGRRRARQQQQQQQQQQQHGRTSKRKRFETILRLFSAASRNSARAIPPPLLSLSLSLSLSLFPCVCFYIKELVLGRFASLPPASVERDTPPTEVAVGADEYGRQKVTVSPEMTSSSANENEPITSGEAESVRRAGHP